MSIQVSSVSKTYGKQKALDNVSFECKKGIIGFLGPNGAGKSTMMKILTGYIQANEGNVFVNGIDVLENPKEAQKNIGYLPEHNPLYGEMYVREYLKYRAEIYKVAPSIIEECITRVGLTTEAHKKIQQLSKGYQQRVGIAAAILHDPEVLILDEPTTGLDPNQLVEIRSLIKTLGKEKTVLLSTHIMQEVEAICDRVIIIKKGKIIVDKSLETLQQSSNQKISVVFENSVNQNTIKQIPKLSKATLVGTTWHLVFDGEKDMRAEVFDFAQENKLKILELTSTSKTLESLFREITN